MAGKWDKRSVLLGIALGASAIILADKLVVPLKNILGLDGDTLPVKAHFKDDGLMASVTCNTAVDKDGNKTLVFQGKTVPVPYEGGTTTEIEGAMDDQGKMLYAAIKQKDNGRVERDDQLDPSDDPMAEINRVFRPIAGRCVGAMNEVPGVSG